MQTQVSCSLFRTSHSNNFIFKNPGTCSNKNIFPKTLSHPRAIFKVTCRTSSDRGSSIINTFLMNKYPHSAFPSLNPQYVSPGPTPQGARRRRAPKLSHVIRVVPNAGAKKRVKGWECRLLPSHKIGVHPLALELWIQISTVWKTPDFGERSNYPCDHTCQSWNSERTCFMLTF